MELILALGGTVLGYRLGYYQAVETSGHIGPGHNAQLLLTWKNDFFNPFFYFCTISSVFSAICSVKKKLVLELWS